MFIHFLLLYVIFVFAYIYRKRREHNKKSKIILICIFGILNLFIGMRNINIGTDTVTYVALFLEKNYAFSNLEIIPQIISWSVGLITNRYCIYLLILSAISLYGIYKNAMEYEFDTEYFIFLYMTSFCYLYSTSAVRFFCAFSIIMLSFKYMIKKENVKVLLLIFLATLFHSSSIIFVPIYFLTKFRFSWKNLSLLGMFLVLLILLQNIINFGFIYKYTYFSKYEYILENQNSVGGLSVLINFGILLFGVIYYKSIKVYKEEYEFFLKMQVIGMMLDFVGIAYRVIWYFKFPIWFILPIVLKNLKIEKKVRDYKIIYFCFIIVYSVVYYYMIKNSLDTHNLLTYEFNYMFM